MERAIGNVGQEMDEMRWGCIGDVGALNGLGALAVELVLWRVGVGMSAASEKRAGSTLVANMSALAPLSLPYYNYTAIMRLRASLKAVVALGEVIATVLQVPALQELLCNVGPRRLTLPSLPQ